MAYELFVATANRATGGITTKIVEFRTREGVDTFIKILAERNKTSSIFAYDTNRLYDDTTGSKL
jgi:hypothetical protein